MRLRPSGNQGPVATSLQSFANYHHDGAWTWEHLALTRARVVAGDPGLAADIEALRVQVLTAPQDQPKVLADVAEMRDRIAAAKTPAGVWDAKIGPGRLQDIELIAQTGALLGGAATRDVASGLRAGVACGWLTADIATQLTQSYALFWSVQMAARLISGKVIEADRIGQGGVAFFCRSTGYDDVDALQAALTRHYVDCAAWIDQAVHQEGAA